MGKGGALSRQLLILVVVLATIATLAALFIVTQTLRSRRRRSAPLPPVQPLAHHPFTKPDLDGEPPSPLYSTIPSSTGVSTMNASVLKEAEAHLSPSSTPGFANSNLSAISLASTDGQFSPPACSPAGSGNSPKPRPLSTNSIPNGSVSRRGSRATLRGVPHAPHNQMEIILPTPLSPNLNRKPSSSGYSTRWENGSSDRISIADQWVAPRSLAAGCEI
jgi:hypothetical protein